MVSCAAALATPCKNYEQAALDTNYTEIQFNVDVDDSWIDDRPGLVASIAEVAANASAQLDQLEFNACVRCPALVPP